MSPRDREQILSSLELSLGFPPREDALVTPAAAPFQGRWLEGGESWEPFQKEIQALSGRFHWAETLQEARSAVRTILAEHGVRRAIQWEHPFLETLGIDNLLQDAGVERIFETAGERFPRQCAQAELGITAADAVIVESGTVLVLAKVDQPRSVSLVPPIHLAVVTPGQRLGSVAELPPLIRQWREQAGGLPSAIHLITGPSRTADIELTMVLGAHGPKVLHVLAVDPALLPAPL